MSIPDTFQLVVRLVGFKMSGPEGESKAQVLGATRRLAVTDYHSGRTVGGCYHSALGGILIDRCCGLRGQLRGRQDPPSDRLF